MSYAVEKMDAEHALSQLAEYRYALVYRISGITLCAASDFDNADWDECFEARFFDEEKELHIYEEDGVLHAVRSIGTADGDSLVKKYRLQDRYFGQNKYLCICEHLDYDEDGQAFVALTRLTGIE